MAIKKNAQKLLLALYAQPDQHQVTISVHKLRYLVPDMSEGGYRSLLLFLERRNFLFRERVFGSVAVGITEAGKEALIRLFPALDRSWNSWNGQWMVLVFLNAPKSDPNFRYLRQLLLSEKSLALSRGVYLAAGSFSNRILMETKQLYNQSVVILSADKWHWGLERPVIVKYYDLASRAEVYSGIGSELRRLLSISEVGKKLTDQQKSAISSIIERFAESLKEDPGFTSHYFPGVPGAIDLVSQIQKVISL